MKTTRYFPAIAATSLVALLLLNPSRALAHCDTLDGPVVKDAQKALAEGNVNLVLHWVQKDNENEIKQSFQRTLAVRKLGADAKELADHYFFETLVRVHRAGEGAPYTGLKPAGTDLGPVIPAADKALDTGNVSRLLKMLDQHMTEGVRDRFKDAVSKKKFQPNDVAAGREYVQSYVQFVHYVEGIHTALTKTADKHGHGTEGQKCSHAESPSPSTGNTPPSAGHHHD